MATSSKKRCVNLTEEKDEKTPVSKGTRDSESSEDEGEEGGFGSDDDSDVPELNEEIQVEFEALPPHPDDFHGIKRLLQQLFLKSKVNLSTLIDIILGQSHVGSVIKQSADQLAELDLDSDESDEDQDGDNIFGFITVINITSKKNEGCIQEIKTLLDERCSQCESASKASEFSHLLNNSSHSIGLLINERFVNIPPQLAPPLHNSLQKDVTTAAVKNSKFKFDYYLLLSKTYKDAISPEQGSSKKKSKGTKIAESDQLMFANAEDEYFHKESVISFDYPVTDESDTALGGKWTFDDAEMRTFRTVMIVPASKMQHILTQIEDNLTM
ncbi:protein BCCIP homolog [Amphiura filiformis]|uniref:protein BCCIP homolog n=1 Tax=Amphiura filiformis TaxID=82378 RepID=UPI003B21664B